MLNKLSTWITKKQLPLFSLIFLLAVMPFNFLLSFGVILLAISVFFSQALNETFYNLKSRPDFILFSSTYLLYLLALLHTENISFGMRELEYKLSLFIMPIVLAAMPKLSEATFRKIAKVFIVSTILSSILCIFISTYRTSFQYLPTYIELSVFMHPTYASAYLNLAFIFLIKLFGRSIKTKREKVGVYSLAAFMVGFNFLLNSKIGILLNLLLIFIFLIQLGRQKSKKTLYSAFVLFFVSLVLVFTQVSTVKNRFQYISHLTKVENIPNDSEESTYLRILIWNQVGEIFQENKWFGVGTGDTKDALMEKYKKNNISYAYTERLNAHNQYLEWVITFGLLGLIAYLISIIFPLIKTIKSQQFLYVYFLAIVLIIFTVESFLEREVGIVFFTFFNGLLYYHSPNQQSALKS
ncbi:MAG: hypothetical protein CMC96_12965 [Flavobacteriales bacterium]|nr:hypothetical protein [Flavobacteriales bacterium]|tara:strand:- start:17966 stop:19195 length:1230 start_codon:yes stop_codon:yes gene_type:complete